MEDLPALSVLYRDLCAEEMKKGLIAQAFQELRSHPPRVP